MRKMEKLLETAVAQYEDGYPIHLSNPKKSAITAMSMSHYEKMTIKEVQDTLRNTHILISDCVGPALQFNRDGLRTICSPNVTIEVHGKFQFPFQIQWLIPACRSVYRNGPRLGGGWAVSVNNRFM